MREISKPGRPGATRRSEDGASRTLKRKRKKTSYARRRQIALLALLGGLLLAGIVAIYSLAGGDDEINQGVTIGSVDVGG